MINVNDAAARAHDGKHQRDKLRARPSNLGLQPTGNLPR
jgi:hypothetical protein